MARNGQSEGGSQIEMVWLIALILVILVGWATWTYAKAFIVLPAFAIDWAFIWIVEHTKGIGEKGQEVKDYIESFFDGRSDASNEKHINWETFSYVRSLVGSQVNWVISAFIIGLAMYIKVKMKGDGYQRSFSLAGGKGKGPSFAKFQSEFWKVSTYSSHFEPDGRDAGISPAPTPTEWMRDNNITFEKNEINNDSCTAAFTEQLGKRWHGLERASINGQVALLICALHYLKLEANFPNLGKRNISLHEREQLSIAWAGGKDGLPAMKAFVAKYKDNKKVTRIIDAIASKHAYENTVIYAMLDRARAKGGVLKESDMAYIKKLDRDMWYGLNNCGRKRFHTAGAGIISHYFAERIVNRALIEPHVSPAVDGVENYMNEEGIESLTDYFSDVDEDAY